MQTRSNLTFGFLLLLTGILCLASCKGNHSDEPAPSTELPVSTASANFTSNLKLADVNQTVTFSNQSTNATRYTWYFGDGDSAHTVNGSHKYLHPGTYNVILKAYDNQGIAAVKVAPVAVGERYISELIIKKMKFTDPAGAPWDNGNGPDVWLGYIRMTQVNYMPYYRVKTNLNAGAIPYTHKFEAKPFTNEEFKFVLAEFDSISPTNGTSQQMAAWNLNPVQATKWDSVTQTGYVELKNNDYEIRFNLKLLLK